MYSQEVVVEFIHVVPEREGRRGYFLDCGMREGARVIISSCLKKKNNIPHTAKIKLLNNKFIG